MITLLVMGCYTLRSSIGYESVDTKSRIHLSEHLRLSHIYGPTIHVEIAPEEDIWLQQFSVHAELSLASIAMGLEESFQVDFGLNEEHLLTQALLLSSIGSNVFHYQYDENSGAKYGLFTPYIMLHTPPFCLDNRSIFETSICLSVHSQHQVQLYLYHPTEVRWSIGISVHNTNSLIKER